MLFNFFFFVSVLTLYLDYVSKLKHDEVPDYEFCKSLFNKELKTLPGKVSGKLDFSSEEAEGRAKSLTPKKTPVRAKRKPTVVEEETKESSPSDVDSDDIFVRTPTPKKVKKKAVMKTDPVAGKPPPKSRAKKDETQKPSWRDAPAIVAGGVTKAGEYVKKDLPPRKKTTRK